MKKKKGGFLSVEYIIVACASILIFMAFAVSFQQKEAGRRDTIISGVDDNGPILPDTSNNPLSSNPACFTTGDIDTIVNYDETCGVDVIIPSEINGHEITTIGAGAFRNKGIANLSLSSKITTIEANAFQDNLIRNVLLPNSVTTVGEEAFMNNQISNLYIPSTLTSMGARAFNKNLLPAVSAYIYAYTALGRDATQLVSYGGANPDVSIPYGVTGLQRGAFMDTRLRSVSIPATVTRIDDAAFQNNLLESATFAGNVPTVLGANIFAGNSDLIINTIKVPAAQLAAYRAKYAGNFGVSTQTVFY